MPGLLKITDKRVSTGANGKQFSMLAFDIGDLLALIPTEGLPLTWSVFPTGEGTEITGDFSPIGMTSVEFCSQVDEAEEGVMLSWEEMGEIAALIQQTIWGTYIGCKDAATFEGLITLYQDQWLYVDDATPAYYDAVEVAFQACDSSFWLVYARNDAVLQRIRTAFQSVETLRTWS